MEYSWDKITLENYAAIDSLVRAGAPADRLGYLLHYASMLSLATGKSEDYYENLPLSELANEAERLIEFLKKEPEGKAINTFRFKGRKFTIALSPDEITTNQVSSATMLKLTSENMASKMPDMLAAMVTEKKVPFRKPLSFSQKRELFKALPASTGISICVFFWNLSNELQPCFLNYLEKEGEKLQQMVQSHLPKN